MRSLHSRCLTLTLALLCTSPLAFASAPPAIGAPLPPPLQAPVDEAKVLELEWQDLLPEEARPLD